MNEEDIAANPVFKGWHWAFHDEMDKAKREVRAVPRQPPGNHV